MNFDETPEFKKDVKALKKRVPTLRADLKRAKNRIITSLYIPGDNMTQADFEEYRRQFFGSKRGAVLPGSTNEIEIVKIRLDSDTNQYRDKLRIVFTAIKSNNNVLFIEIYSKNDKNREDTARIKRYT